MERRICSRAASPCWRPRSRCVPLISIVGRTVAPIAVTPLRARRSIRYGLALMSLMTTTGKGQVASQPRSGTASQDERIAARRGDLSPAELRVVEYIAAEREEVAFLSAAEIARELATSDATVIRAAQALGYAGLPDLKAELQDALRSRATPVLRLGRSLEELGDDPAAILEHALAT